MQLSKKMFSVRYISLGDKSVSENPQKSAEKNLSAF